MAGKMGSPSGTAYSLTKFAINGYFEGLRIEIAKDNISINTICPGPVAATDNSLNSVTENENDPGKLRRSRKSVSSYMRTDRCAHLYSTSMAHDIFESWISPKPILFYGYLKQYLPILSGPLTPLLGKRYIESKK